MKKVEKIFLESKKKRLKAAYAKIKNIKKSKTEHVKLCLNKGRPLSKLKYNLIDR